MSAETTLLCQPHDLHAECFEDKSKEGRDDLGVVVNNKTVAIKVMLTY